VQTGPSQHDLLAQVQSLALQLPLFTLADAETTMVINTPATMLKIIFFILIVFCLN